ncbi:hypothetical protein JYU34_021375 [Plutella xylostella]|uniref:EF-hand domain-containing protein n=1 Tax=Plutella xylostella TaxID=51655 RepID=A0ABQ7PTG4_PLUXY|nr:hypothetical protein JYU34_021375 [Plutella xylostella]
MPPKGKGKGKGKLKKGKENKGKELAAQMLAKTPKPKPKKIPPPPKCFTPDDLARFKDLFKLYDEENMGKVPLELIPVMLRKLGFNPKGAEIQQLFAQFLEDELVDTVEYHEFLFMIEAKMNWGDDFEYVVMQAMAVLADDKQEAKVTNLDLIKEELQKWGEPLTDVEFSDWIRLATRDKTYDIQTGSFLYEKFIDNMNTKDAAYKFLKEPINYFKLDQKTLAALAQAKAQKEKEEENQRLAVKALKDEARRLKMIADGLLPEGAALPPSVLELAPERQPTVTKLPTESHISLKLKPPSHEALLVAQKSIKALPESSSRKSINEPKGIGEATEVIKSNADVAAMPADATAIQPVSE